MAKLNEYYLAAYKQYSHSNNLFVKWNWSAFLFGPMWLVYRGMFLYTLIYVSLVFLEIFANYFFKDAYIKIVYFFGNIFFGMYGTSLFLRTYKLEILNQLNAPQVVLNSSGEEKQEIPNISMIEKELLKLKRKADQFICLIDGEDFIQTVVSKEEAGKKFFHVEYFNSEKNILFESKNLQTLEQTLDLFNLFLGKDESLSVLTSWVRSDIVIDKDEKRSSRINIKTRPFLAFISYIFIVVIELVLSTLSIKV